MESKSAQWSNSCQAADMAVTPLCHLYVAMDKKLDARQYLLSLQQNYQADDDIAGMIEERLAKLKE